jgi:hypothetical protein
VKIRDLPFRERPVLELLALDHPERAEPDLDYAGFGWARVPSIYLQRGDRDDLVRVDDALVIAVHSADDAPAHADDLDLEFDLGAGRAGAAVMASAFLDAWLPALPRDAAATVVVACNPHRATLRRPAAASGPLHYAHGDVIAWLDEDLDRIRLAADAWLVA